MGSLLTVIDDSCVREYPGSLFARSDPDDTDGEQLLRDVERLRERKRELLRKGNLALQAKIQVLQERIKKPSVLKYLPGGRFMFCPSDPPVVVTEADAAKIEGVRIGIVASGKSPFFDFSHLGDGRISFYPFEFYWDPAAGVMAKGRWTAEGLAAVKSGQYKFFSPTYYGDGSRASRPIICVARANANMGGICNNPRFGATMRLDPNLVFTGYV
jgi:hypothetical protein